MTPPAADVRTVSQSTPGAHDAPRIGLPGEFADALPAGTRLHEFEILSVIGQGGFGIVYLAHDVALDRRVAIKEYMPSALATRTQAMTVAVRSSRHTETFAAGLRSFINEARLLAQFDHPSLLKVHRFWEAHGTAYMVMPYYEGITLAQRLAQPGGPPDEAWLRALLDPLLDALAQMHAAHCYHRDIAPDNILLLPNSTPLLLDFGAARHVIADMSQALTVILKTGYAPVEQYGDVPDMTQGPWTDLYALGSVVEFATMGRTPPQAVTRFLADKREPLAVAAAGRYSDGFLRAIDRALAVHPKDRPQDVAEMRALLAVAATATIAAHDPDVTVTMRPKMARPSLLSTREPAPMDRPAAAPPMRWRGIATAGALAIAALTGGGVWFMRASAPVAGTAAPPAAGPPAPSAADAAAPPAAQAPPAEPAAQTPAPPPPLLLPPVETPAAAAQTAPQTAPLSPPDRAPTAAAPKPEAARPRKQGSAQATGPPPPVARADARPKVPSARCADIIQRVSLGEPLSDAEKSFLQRECGP